MSVVWAKGSTWANSQSISAAYSASGSNGYETWTFSGTASGATQFYIKYTVSGADYYDPGNNANHQIVGSTPTTSTSASTPVTSPTSSLTTSTGTTTVSSDTSTAEFPTGTVAPGSLPPIIPSSIPDEAPATSPSGCGTFNGGDNCNGNSYEMAPSSEKRRWQTPPRGDADYKESFQDYSHLVGYADIKYNAGRNSAVVTVNAASKTNAVLTYNFGGTTQSSPTFQVSSSLTGALPITVTSSDGKKLVLEPLNFFWQHQSLSAAQASFNGGQKGGIVELFGWPYDDVAKECTFLGKAGKFHNDSQYPELC